MMQLNKHAFMFFSLLCDSIGTTLEKSHFEGKANNEIAQTSLVEYITYED